jgi:hypothetical protein
MSVFDERFIEGEPIGGSLDDSKLRVKYYEQLTYNRC